MKYTEFSQRFDVLYNNITSNQAPGLNEYEKSVFLTEGQLKYIKDQFYALNNAEKAGFDNSRKRYTDFAGITKTAKLDPYKDKETSYVQLDPRSYLYYWPEDILFIINEQLIITPPKKHERIDAVAGTQEVEEAEEPTPEIRQIVPVSYGEYSRLMSKPFKQPLKYQGWRLLTNYDTFADLVGPQSTLIEKKRPLVELVLNNEDKKLYDSGESSYILRYIRIPNPIITANLSQEYGEVLEIQGMDGPRDCELHESVHEEILQTAVELAKQAWEGSLQSQANNSRRGA